MSILCKYSADQQKASKNSATADWNRRTGRRPLPTQGVATATAAAVNERQTRQSLVSLMSTMAAMTRTWYTMV